MPRSAIVDAIEKFRYTVAWSDGLTRAGFSECGIPKSTVTKGTYREGNAPENMQYFAGLQNTEDIVLGRGTTTNQDFYEWLRLVFDPETTPQGLPNVQGPGNIPITASAEYRKDVIITIWGRGTSGATPRKQWILFNAWPVAFQPGSDLNASEDDEKSIEQITLGYESFTEISGDEIVTPAQGENQIP